MVIGGIKQLGPWKTRAILAAQGTTDVPAAFSAGGGEVGKRDLSSQGFPLYMVECLPRYRRGSESPVPESPVITL